MNFYKVAPTVLIRKDAVFFTYSSPQEFEIGTIVKIPVGKKKVIGIIISEDKKPTFDTKEIIEQIEQKPLPKHLLKLAEWMAKYYQTHLSLNLKLILPTGIDKKRRKQDSETKIKSIREKKNKTPTNEQKNAIKNIISSNQTTNILFGVTGSGKTLVYIECIKNYFKQGLSSIVLVPEIGLTSQVVDEFISEFGQENIVLTHSQQTEAERHKTWLKVLNSDQPKIIIGPRSALFLPINKLGLIVVDEFHEPSYKQEQQPKYSTIRVATMLAKFSSSKTVFGSATPPVAEYYLIKNKRANLVKLNKTAQKSSKPEIFLIDMKRKDNFLKHRFVSDELISQIEQNLENKKQSLIFHNRRGSTAITLCKNCGWTAIDPVTEIPLSLHADKHRLVSHMRDYSIKVPTSCPECGEPEIIHKGIGTKLIETELKKIFPKASIARFDGDVKNSETVNSKYQDLYEGNIDIIIGTQVIAKGIDLPKLTTVGVIQADTGLSLPDFNSNERAFQLLAQVVGRVGRNKNESKIIIQSYQPKHFSIQTGITQNYEDFYKEEIKIRKKGYFPPFSYLLKISCVYKTEVAAVKNAKKLFKELKKDKSENVKLFGPTPAFYEKMNGTFRWQIIAKSSSRQDLLEIIKKIPPSKWQYEIDPISLL